jgi:hypothetical protein
MRWLIALLFLAPQDAKLEPKAVVGEKATVSVDSTLDLEILVRDGEGESTRFLSVVRREKFTQEVTRVADGAPAALAIACVSSTLQRSGTNLALGTSTTPLAGKSFVGVRSPQGWIVKDQEGKGVPDEGRSLGAWNEYVRLLPRGAVKTNDVWKVDGREVAELLFPPGTTEVAGALECSLESMSGGRATILIKGAIEGRAKDETILALALSGSRLVFDTRSGKAQLLAINGSLETKRTIAEAYPRAEDGREGKKDESRKIGEILSRSRKLEVSFIFE